MRLIQASAGALVAAAYSTMVLGAYVKAIGAGMACEEWGTCNNGDFFYGPDAAGTAAEVAHRIAATAVVAAGALLLALELRDYRYERRLLLMTLAAAGLLALQISLGALTIFSNLQALVVTAHLAVATLFFALTLVIALRVWKLPPPTVHAAAPAPGPEGEALKST